MMKVSDCQFIQNDYSFPELLPVIQSGKKVVLYGAGTAPSSYARIAIPAFRSFGIEPIAFVDDDLDRQGEEFLGIKVKPPSYIESLGSDAMVFLSSNYFESIARTIKTIGKTENIYSCTGILRAVNEDAYTEVMSFEEVQRRLHTHTSKLNRIQAMSRDENSALILNAIDIQVTERCTMKCIDCSNLMQYYKKPKDADQELLEDNVEKILSAVDKIYDVRILGGEPFLYKHLPKLLEMICESAKVSRITVYTNATFVPKPEILEALKNNIIEVEITDYDELSRNRLKMIDTFKEHKIRFIDHKPQNWTDSARVVKSGKKGKELALMFERCCVNDVLSLLHGRIYHCPFSANAHNLEAIPVDKTDWIDLSETKNPTDLRLAISKFYFGKAFQSACKFCLGRDFEQPKVIPALQTKKPIDIPIVFSV